MVRWDCFAYVSATEDGCEALNKRDCDNCKFYKTKDDNETEKQNCELRIRRIYGMSTKNFLYIRRKEND